MHRSLYRESAAIVLGGGLVIYLMAAKAFDAYFFGENFSYLKLYYDHGGNFWHAFFSPINGIFFRPVVFAFQLPWHFLLPPTPLAFHLRNFGIVLLLLFLLHRVLCEVTASRAARILGCVFFAVSKIHLSLIGHIGTTDNLVLSTLLLLTALCFLRFARSQRWWDYLWGMAFCILSVFSKDYGLVVVVVVVAIALLYGVDQATWRRDLQSWAWRLLPLGLVLLGYFTLRFSLVSSIPRGLNYTPEFSLAGAAWKTLLFTATLWNTSLVDNGSTGTSGLPLWLATRLNLGALGPLNAVYYGLCSAAFGAMIWFGRRTGPRVLFPLIWIVAYLGPTLVVQGVHAYYHFEPMIGAAVLLALVADAAGARTTVRIGFPLVAVIALSGWLSNQDPRYHWSNVSAQVAPLQQAVIARSEAASLASITFAARDDRQQFWKFALADPMLQEMTGHRDLQVRFATYADVAYRRIPADRTHWLLDADHGFAPLQPGSKADPTLPDKPGPPVLVSISPNSTRAGQPFTVQPNGLSAISLACHDATPKTVVVWNGVPLLTAYGNSSYVTALVPAELYAAPGTCDVFLADGPLASNRLKFLVLSR